MHSIIVLTGHGVVETHKHLVMKAFPQFLALALAALTAPLCAEDTEPFHFDNVQLSLPASWSSAVKGRLVPALPLYNKHAAALFKADPMNQLKPGYENMPRHVELRLSLPAVFPVKEHAFQPEITVHPVAEFARIYEPEKDSEKNMLKAFDEVWSVASEPAKRKAGKPLPFIPFLDAEQGVSVCFRPVKFAGGKGFRFITQFDIEASLLSERGLVYVFQGMTDDRKTYVLATFPVRLDGLLKDFAGEHLGYSTKDYERLEKEITTYRSKAGAWIEANQERLVPDLKTLDAIMASLVLGKK